MSTERLTLTQYHPDTKCQFSISIIVDDSELVLATLYGIHPEYYKRLLFRYDFYHHNLQIMPFKLNKYRNREYPLSWIDAENIFSTDLIAQINDCILQEAIDLNATI